MRTPLSPGIQTWGKHYSTKGLPAWDDSPGTTLLSPAGEEKSAASRFGHYLRLTDKRALQWDRILGYGDNPPQGPAKSHLMAYWNNYTRMRGYKNSTGVLCTSQLSVSNSSILNGLVLDFLGHLLYGRELIHYYDQCPSSPREEAHRIPQGKRREASGSNPDCSSPLLALPSCLSHLRSVLPCPTLAGCTRHIWTSITLRKNTGKHKGGNFKSPTIASC